MSNSDSECWTNAFGHKVVVEGSVDNDDKPVGDVFRMSNDHTYEMGVRHECGNDGCPANRSVDTDEDQ